MSPNGTCDARGPWCIQFILILRIQIGYVRKEKDDRQDQYHRTNCCVRNVKLRMGDRCAAFAVKELASNDRAENPAHSVERLREVDTERAVLFWTENGCVRVGHGFKNRQPHRNETHAKKKRPELRKLGTRKEPKPPKRNEN